MAELTVYRNSGGLALSKTLSLGEDGKLIKTAAAAMTTGQAFRVDVETATALADLLENKLTQADALGIGVFINPELKKVKIKIRPSDGDLSDGYISRTLKHFNWKPDGEGWMLIDMDLGQCPPELAARLKNEGVVAVLKDYIPGLEDADFLIRPSTSAKLRNSETGEVIIGSRGLHIYIRLKEAADIPRATDAIFKRIVADGIGWIALSSNGRRLVRSIVDETVASAERLIFEGPPILIKPVDQDPSDRECRVFEGEAYDSVAMLPNLTAQELAQYDAVVAQMKESAREASAAKRSEYIEKRAPELAAEQNMPVDVVRARLKKQFARGDDGGDLLHPSKIHLDNGQIVTVMDILRDPAKYHNLTAADPDEGPDYGWCKARIYYRQDNGSVTIHSLAHGISTNYRLRATFDVIAKAIEDAAASIGTNIQMQTAVVERIADMIITAGDALSAIEEDELTELIEKQLSVRRRALATTMKKRKALLSQIEEQERQARRRSNLPEMERPEADAPLGPVVARVDRILAEDTSEAPPMRDANSTLCRIQVREPVGLHLFASMNADGEVAAPPPEPLITTMNNIQIHMMLEAHVDVFKIVEGTDGVARRFPVRLPDTFISALRTNEDSSLPLARGVCTLPFVAGGSLLTGSGFDRGSGLFFRVDSIVSRSIPTERPSLDDAISAMQFLLEQWLCDALTDTAGKIIVIGLALTVIQRYSAVEQPAFMISANMRGSGKTTLLNMIAMAVLGRYAAAARWSESEEERRKALLAPLEQGVPLVVWDNLQRGASVDCDALNSAITSSTYEDRRLGANETVRAPANTIFALNGNNISPTGDFARRVLVTELSSERPDPENRDYTHTDPIGWTNANRARIINALYTILLWNPLRDSDVEVDPDRVLNGFRSWWTWVGYPLEELSQYFAEEKMLFRDIVRASETVSPEVEGLRKMLSALHEASEGDDPEFTAADVAEAINDARSDMRNLQAPKFHRIVSGRAGDIEDGIALSMPKGSALPPYGRISAVIMGRKLAALKDRPVAMEDGAIMTLRGAVRHQSKVHYSVEVKQ